jgi:hypothetical protein
VEESQYPETYRERDKVKHLFVHHTDGQKRLSEHFRQEWFPHPSEAKTRECYTQLARREIGIEMFQDALGEGGKTPAPLQLLVYLRNAHFDKRKFSNYEKSIREHDKKYKYNIAEHLRHV